MTLREALSQLAKSVLGLVIVVATLVLVAALWGHYEVARHGEGAEHATR